MRPTRRHFLASSLACAPALAAANRPPQVLLRSSWQSVNIGDIGHTPGALDLLAKFYPEAEITLWPGRLDRDTRALLTTSYPKLKIAEGILDPQNRPNTPALAKAWEEADLYLSGSGSGFPASAHAVAFQKATGKPVGVFGVSTDPVSGIGPNLDPEGGTLEQIRTKAVRLPPTQLAADLRYIIDHSAFFFCRDSISRDYLKAQQVKTPILEFGPDAQLGMRLRDDAKAVAYLSANQLADQKFICVIPRLRYTPYYRVNNARAPPPAISKTRSTHEPRPGSCQAARNDRCLREEHGEQSPRMPRNDLSGRTGKAGARGSAAGRGEEERGLAGHLLDARRGCLRVRPRPGSGQPGVPLAADRTTQRHAHLLRAPTHRYLQRPDVPRHRRRRLVFEIDETDGGRLWQS
jgi:hypothetical protein